MCGIAGVLCFKENLRWLDLVHRIVRAQVPRGPDHWAVEGIPCKDGEIIFGHNRLSIIDLNPRSNQPLWDVSRRCCLIFNGEIYNYLELRSELKKLGHTFITESDSEVILEAFKEWGMEAVTRFNGMFAFALYDSAMDKLWLVRDRFGIKPLFYIEYNGSLIFASTAATIAHYLGCGPNLEYLSRGLKYWFYEDDADISPYAGIKTLPAGHYLECTLSKGRFQGKLARYYDLIERVQMLRDEFSGRPLASLQEQVQNCLENAVEIRLRSDVPLGISLSGGLDSSIIAALVAKKHSQVTGFVFGHQDDPLTEGPAAQETCEMVKVTPSYVYPTVPEIAQAFWTTLEAQEGPFPDMSIVAQNFVFKSARAKGIPVMLGGQGGDEVFMGYRKFQLFALREHFHRGDLGKAASSALGMARFLAAELRDLKEYWTHRGRYFGGKGIETILNLPIPKEQELSCGESPLWMRQALDILRFSLPTLLRYEDRNSMGNSVESRLPYMDYRLVEIGVALPESAKLSRGYGKWIIRQLTKGLIPEKIRKGLRKRGFDTQKDLWIRDGLGKSIRERLQKNEGKIKGWLKPGCNIFHAFSDRELTCRRNAVAEASTLIWLAERFS